MDVEVNLCVNFILHFIEGFACLCKFFASNDGKDEINHCGKDKTDAKDCAHGLEGFCAQAPECKDTSDDESNCDEDVCSDVGDLLHFLVKDSAFGNDFTGIAETDTKIFHPTVAECCGHFLAETG